VHFAKGPFQGVWGQKSPSRIQERNPGRGFWAEGFVCQSGIAELHKFVQNAFRMHQAAYCFPKICHGTVTLADLGITHFYGEGMGRGEIRGTPSFRTWFRQCIIFLTSLQTKATAIQL